MKNRLQKAVDRLPPAPLRRQQRPSHANALRALARAALLLCQLATARDIVQIGTGMAMPPYVIPESDSGLEVEIVRAAFSAVEIETQFIFMPPARALAQIKGRQIDAITTVSPGVKGIVGFWSDPHISYHNYAITLENRGLQVREVSDLKAYSVAAFQNARLFLGPEYAGMATNHPNYREYPDQKVQAKLLLSQRVDVAIADRLIFNHLVQNLPPAFAPQRPLRFAPIFPPTAYRMLCVKESTCERFNRGLKIIHDNGEYQRIEKRYNAGPDTPPAAVTPRQPGQAPTPNLTR